MRRRFRSSAQPPCAWPRPSPEVGEEPPAPHLDSPEVGEEPRASPPQPSTQDAPVLLLPAPCAVPRRRWGRPCLAPRRPNPPRGPRPRWSAPALCTSPCWSLSCSRRPHLTRSSPQVCIGNVVVFLLYMSCIPIIIVFWCDLNIHID